MYLSTGDEWTVAIAALTLAALTMFTVWLVIFFIDNNKKRSRWNDMMDVLGEIMKPSKNGRDKKTDG